MEAEIRPRPATEPVSQPTWRQAVIWFADRELWWMVLPVTAIVFVNQLPWNWVATAVLVIPLLWLLRITATGTLTVRTPLDVPLSLVLFTALVGFYPSVDRAASLRVLVKMVVEIGLFYSLVNAIRSQESAWGMARLLAAVGVAMSLLSLVNTQWITHKVFSLPGIYERLPKLLPVLNKVGFHPNIVGGTLAMILPLNIGLFLMALRAIRWQRAGEAREEITGWQPEHPLYLAVEFSLMLAVVGGTLVLTQSRGAWLGTAAALLLMALWWRPRFLWGVPIAGLAVVLFVRHVGLTAVTDFFLISDAATSTQGRLELWGRTIYMMQDFPYTGIGLGTFETVLPVMYPVFILGPKVPHAHNLWLQIGVDLGLPGLVAYTAVLAALACIALHTLYRTRGQTLEPLALACVGAFVVFVVHGLVDHVTFSTKPGTVLWAILGLTVAVWRLTFRSS